MTEREKMDKGLWYDANNDLQLLEDRMLAQDLCFELNQLKPSLDKERNQIIEKILGYQPQSLILLCPFACDYGKNIVFVNINCYFMDG